MGQTIGRAPLLPAARHFTNLPKSNVYELWEAFNDIAEGFGLTIDEFLEIVRVCLKDYLEYSEKKMDQIARAVFGVLDDDANDLVDALEALSALCVLSGMTPEEKIKYVFGIFDFDESGLLSVDEMILCLRTAISGLCKLSAIDAPLETDIEHIAIQAFGDLKSIDGSMVSRERFVAFCSSCPEIVSWMEYYGDIDEFGTNAAQATDKMCDLVVVHGTRNIFRTNNEQASMDLEWGATLMREIESRGLAKDIGQSPPWRSIVPFTEPSELPTHIPESAPDAHLRLDWVHGFNSKVGRQTVHYSHKGDIIYAAGALCVVYSLSSHSQAYLNAHTDLVIALTVKPLEGRGRTLCASAEAGKTPKVLVWSPAGTEAGSGPEVQRCLTGFHKDGVSHLAFSPDARLLLTVGSTGHHSVAVYDWQAGSLEFASLASIPPILDATWSSETQFVTCGVNHVHFWNRDGDSYKRERGLFGKKVEVQPVLCAKPFGKVVITGCATGHVTVWEGRNCIRSIKGHSGGITAMHVIYSSDPNAARKPGNQPMEESAGASGMPTGLVTGSTDGKIQIWNSQLELSTALELGSLGGLSRVVQSVQWDEPNHKILVASFSSEIYEMHDAEGYDIHDGALVQGHYEHRVFGLCVSHTDAGAFVTVGEDRTIRLWDANEHRVKAMATMDTMAHCVDFSPDGELLAVGLGYTPKGFGPNAKRQRKDGAFAILSAKDLTIIHEARDSKHTINAIRFSPDGGLLAVASGDKFIYLYATGDWASVAKCRGHKGKVMHLDFSSDSRFLQSNDDIGELLFWEADSGEQRTARTMRDVEWETQTCVYGYPLQGAWGQFDDGTALTHACRSHHGTVLATGDVFGRLRLWRYPCVKEGANFTEYRGHAGPASAVGMTIDDKYLITTGELDCCVLQWRFTVDGPPLDEKTLDDELVGEQLNDMKEPAAYARRGDQELACEDDGRDRIFLMEERAAEEDFTPIRPWRRTVVAPSRPPPERMDEPVDGLRLEWMHGFRAHDVKNGVKCTATGEVLFFGGATNAVLDLRENRQRFHFDHTDEVMAIATHPTRTLVATAQQGTVPRVLIWDYEGAAHGGAMPTVRTLQGQHQRGVTHLSFSFDGKYLATIGLDDLHTIVVYDWENQVVVAQRTTVAAQTFDLSFPPTSTSRLVQCGQQFIRFYDLQGHNMAWKSASLGAVGEWQAFLSVGFVGNRTVVGAQTGKLYLFAGHLLDRTVAAHEGPVTVISSTSEGIATGGHDGYVKVFNTVLDLMMAVNLSQLGSVTPIVRSVDWENETNRLTIGTLGAEIFVVNASDGANKTIGGGPVVQGHSHAGAEVHGLSAHPFLNRFVTVGDDATLRVWDTESHAVVSMQPLEMSSRCVAYSPKGDRLAIGFGSPVKRNAKQFDGKWTILGAEDFSIIHEARDSQKYLTEVKWSPSATLVAFGSFDCKIYVYNVDNGYQLSAVATQHNSMIRSIDFSNNDQYMMANCSAYELCFFEADTCMFLPAASRLKDQRWATQTCAMSWATQGVWPPQNDKTDITTCDANLANEHGDTVLATGDNFGRIRLHRYPCDSALGQSKLYRAHGAGSPISKVRWVGGDSHLVSISAKERIVMQWSHDADDVVVEDMSASVTLEIDPKTREEALGDEAQTALQEVQDPLSGDLNMGTAAQEVSAKPWLSAIVEPSEPPTPDHSLPAQGVALERVFGVQATSARQGLGYNILGEVLWPSACVAIIYSKQTHQQKFYTGHRSEITVLNVSPRGRFVATGERAARPTVHVTDAQTGTPLARLGPFHRQGIACIGWSADERMLVTVGRDIEHSVVLWHSPSGNWLDVRKLAYSSGDPQAVYFASFLDSQHFGPQHIPVSNTASAAAPKHPGYLFVTGGIDHIKFWSLEGRTLTSQRGIWGSQGKVQPMLCGCACGPRVITGGVSGHLYVWRNTRRCDRMLRAHETMVNTLWACPTAIISGSADGFVKVFSERLEHLRSYGIHEATVPPLLTHIKCIVGGVDKTGSQAVKMLVTTTSCEVYELARDSGSFTLLAEGHYSKPQDGASGELWGLCVHPTNPDIFATTGDDGTVRIWSISQGRLLRKAQLDSPSRTISWSPNGRRLLLGFGGSCRGVRQKKDGAFALLSSERLEVVYEGRDARHWIRDAKFSPNGDTFALASQDQKIYLYDTRQNILRGKCDKHNAEVQRVDFSDDGAYLQSDSADYEHLYFSAVDGSFYKLPSQLKNVQWDSWTCKMGWPVQGIWPLVSKSTEESGPPPEPVSVARSSKKNVVAAGYQDGRVKVFRYPCISKTSEGVTLRGHTSDVANVRFTCNDKYMISIGQGDRAIMIWKVE